MVRFIPLLLLLFPLFVKGQQKEEILKTIIKINKLETADKGPFIAIDTNLLSDDEKKLLFEVPNKYDNYKNFQELVKLITRDELVALTKHENGVVRLFAIRQLIKEQDYNFDYFDSFLNEFNRNDTIVSQFADMIEPGITYRILLADLSGDWNSARSTGAERDLKFFNYLSRRIDSFILFKDFDFYDEAYEDIFDRQTFEKSANDRILKLIETKFNFWAFNYFKKNEPAIFNLIMNEVIKNVLINKASLLEEHPNFFKWFLRYMVTNGEFENAREMIQVLKKGEYYNERMDWMLMGIDKKLVDKVR
jgi:hypothetical protein